MTRIRYAIIVLYFVGLCAFRYMLYISTRTHSLFRPNRHLKGTFFLIFFNLTCTMFKRQTPTMSLNSWADPICPFTKNILILSLLLLLYNNITIRWNGSQTWWSRRRQLYYYNRNSCQAVFARVDASCDACTCVCVCVCIIHIIYNMSMRECVRVCVCVLVRRLISAESFRINAPRNPFRSPHCRRPGIL
jgi:hypothetical protein